MPYIKLSKQIQSALRGVRWLERVLAIAVMIGVVAAAVGTVNHMVGLDWSETETFYELINRILLLAIGLEFIRMLVTHHIVAVLELLAFVISRKLIKPDLGALEILFSVLGFIALVAARHYFVAQDSKEMSFADREEGEDMMVES